MFDKTKTYVLRFDPGAGNFGAPLDHPGYVAYQQDGRLVSVPEVGLARRYNALAAKVTACVLGWQYDGATFTPVNTCVSDLNRASP